MANANSTRERETRAGRSTTSNDLRRNVSTGEIHAGVLGGLSQVVGLIPKLATLSETFRKPSSVNSGTPQRSRRVPRKGSRRAPALSEEPLVYEGISKSSRYETVEDSSVPFVLLLPSDTAGLFSAMDLSSPWDGVSKNEDYAYKMNNLEPREDSWDSL